MTLTRTRLTLTVAALLCAIGASVLALAVPQTKAVTAIAQPGDLIKGESFTAVYYMGLDGFRYVFTNDKNYFTWYPDFDDVTTITDQELATIQIGGNVTYKPGVKMVKITSDEDTYAVAAGGTLRHVSSEAIATSLYGANWNTKIDDIADGFFSNYVMGDPILAAADYSPSTETANASSIGVDKGLITPVNISITATGYVPVDAEIVPGQTVRFTNNDSVNHTATADDLTWGTGTLKPGDSFIRKFKEEGTFTFFDSYDSSKTGAVYVE